MITVYLISSNIDNSVCYKIGYTRRDPKLRIKEMKIGNASDLNVVKSFKSKWGTQIEAKLHNIFKDKKINGEWFNLENNDIVSFKSLCEKIHNNYELLSEENSFFQQTNLFKRFN